MDRLTIRLVSGTFLLSFTFGDSHRRKGAETPLPLTASKRDEPIVEELTIGLDSQDSSLLYRR